ncbi:MAG: cation:proton antiporter [Synergistales bacterium]|nr:cation:proton antiporter [Synergistales bacterium]MDY6402313.1 cation:proton antiporter [Synergistales bacterium]MDY6409860.1 cation:proton antiporter [Synergistales bacterium]MDY6414430.1 cation:proton antiporter [Synergistales bacterium]MDY6423115.1 cation:proton antiporter [Synergistales bacterium]
MFLLLKTAFALFAGLMMTRAFKYSGFKFPDVTSFLIAGVLVGPYVLGRFYIGFDSSAELASVNILSNLALGFIAFDIGSEFRVAQLKEMGKAATFIGIFQALAATIFVDVALIALSVKLGGDVLPIPAAITLGAIAAATAPAATLMVVRQFKAKGPVTDLLLPIVALDDAAGLIIFAVSIGVAQAMIGGAINFVSIIINPLIEIISSVILGAFMGWILTQIEKLFFSNSNRLSMTIAFVMMTISLATQEFHFGQVRVAFSSLLVCMTLGTVFCNMCEYSADIMKRSEKWSAPLYAVFFVLSGARLELSVFQYPFVIITGLVYILTRCLGKYFGASISSTIMNCSENVKKYLGITLFPQAGVALGMVVSAQSLGGEMGSLIRNITLFSVLVYELVGPMLTRMALMKAGEIEPAKPEHVNRERFKGVLR